MKYKQFISLIICLFLFFNVAYAKNKLSDVIKECSNPNNYIKCNLVIDFLGKNTDKYVEFARECYFANNPQPTDACINACIFELYYPYYAGKHGSLITSVLTEGIPGYFGALSTLTLASENNINRELHENLCLAFSYELNTIVTYGNADSKNVNNILHKCCLLTKDTICTNVRDDVYLDEDQGIEKGMQMRLEALSIFQPLFEELWNKCREEQASPDYHSKPVHNTTVCDYHIETVDEYKRDFNKRKMELIHKQNDIKKEQELQKFREDINF